jgi:hypothetical protein
MHPQDDVTHPMVSIPFSKKKHYLTGIDWLLQGFDCMNKRATGAGNAFQIVMELEGVPAEDRVRDALDGFVKKFPVLGGRTRRDYNLAPYWEIPRRAHNTSSRLDVHRLEDAAEAFPLLEAGVNAPFGNEREHVAFCLIHAGSNGHAAVKFDHRLFDAHGAEVFLGMFQRDWEKGGGCRWESPPLEPAHLDQWRKRFEAGRNLNRALLRLVGDSPPRALPLDPAASREGFGFSVIRFDQQQSREILQRAESEAGYLMAMPYTMALAVQALHGIFAGRGITAGDYIVPVTMDTRLPSDRPREVFFNHVSLLLFRIRADQADDRSALLKSIKQQMYDQAKAGLARSIPDASLLMRILPLPAVEYLLKLYLKQRIASFCFSFLGDTGHMPDRFMENKVRHSYHMTRVPVPPGLGVFFQHSRGSLNACLSYQRGLLGEAEVNRVLDALRSGLQG